MGDGCYRTGAKIKFWRLLGLPRRYPIKRPKAQGHNGWEKQANPALARLRAPAEHAFAELGR
ncbi:hypothetical protein [Streptomyces sp. NBC_01589]|uniref:hypothetical protein n=1 Tax=unclassified Streptomyces TaxID=2593676 RepID=UPI00386E376B